MKNVKSLKINKLSKSINNIQNIKKSMKKLAATKRKVYKDLIPAFVEYRKQMEKESKLPEYRNLYRMSRRYCYYRIFTEQRVNGARSKYWHGTKSSMPVESMKQYVLDNPTFTTAAGRTYKVDLRFVDGSAFSPYCRNREDLALFCKLVNTQK